MCMQVNAVRPYQRWRWAGDEIVHRPIIPARRTLPGTRREKYDIDIREYLSISTNAVVREWLDQTIQDLAVQDRLRFLFSSTAGTFDFRAYVISTSLSKLRYVHSSRQYDAWQFPEETIALRSGDCEDLAFLLAALLLESGISDDCVRVAFGSLIDHTNPDDPKSWDHAWVVYQRESGAWEILEPLVRVQRGAKIAGTSRIGRTTRASAHDIEYIPHFVFNRHHLWRVRNPQRKTAAPFIKYLDKRDKFWSKFTPSFAASVHDDIFDHALQGMSGIDIATIKSASLGVDANVISYDPRDHFDFAYIDEGWARVKQRLSTGSLIDFGLATHAIADFYAHSLYAYFAKPDASGKLPLYDNSAPIPAEELNYDFLKGATLPDCAWSEGKALKYWSGKLISGQWWRWFTTYPADLKGAAELGPRRCLPDHDFLAVDSPTQDHPDGFFQGAVYAAQFRIRRQAAIDHISREYQNWKR